MVGQGGMYGWFMLRVSLFYLSIYLFNIDFRAYAYEISLSRFYVHLMYIKVISVPELFKGMGHNARGHVAKEQCYIILAPHGAFTRIPSRLSGGISVAYQPPSTALIWGGILLCSMVLMVPRVYLC
jgi:hypothetical protein